MILQILMVVMLAAIAVRLFNMQIIDGEKYLANASSRLTTNVVNKAPRGDILDRYGNVLVTNKTGYSVLMQKETSDNDELNKTIRSVVQILNETENSSYDTLPITMDYPYRFVFEDRNNDNDTADEKQAWFESNKYNGKYINSNMTAEQVVDIYAQIYGIRGELASKETRGMVGIRYDAEIQNFSSANPVTVAQNINVEAVTRIKELQEQLPGISIIEDYVRTYNYPGLATQLLGRTGRISAEEYEKYSSSGYGMNDSIGKQGIEKWAESYLRGTNGKTGRTAVVDGREVEITANVDPVPGNYVMLTLDTEIQSVAEESLENTIKSIGGDCNAGAAVVIDVNSGNTLAMASYPTYDMSRFNEDYEKLINDAGNPMINRAVSGLYSPGSTFKPLTAIAGIQTGNLKLNEHISCEGVYTVYQDYQPTCWIWSEARATHGSQDMTLAIENSCNYFFYELGRRLGIDTLDEYAKKFGLGEYTGVELTEETEGHMASPEYKSKVVMNVIDSEWFGGDTLQTAIGQSYSLFTPIQLANYCATIANGGTRYKVNLIDSIRSSVDGSVVEEFKPQVVEQLDIEPQTMSRVRDGMKKVVDEGSASSIFDGYPIQVGGKTGTAQLGSGSNNAIFIAFAPFDNPQIAVAVVLEHGVRGTNAGRVARDIFDKYFFNSGASGVVSATEAPSEAPASETSETEAPPQATGQIR
ncbi:MAG: hypothetical protein J1G06_07700 [Oscillospiraceae bacterium]|nr:hypothetical protein [Oscillospiraceae bacterium]